MRFPRSFLVLVSTLLLCSGSAFGDGEPVPSFNPLGDMGVYTSVSYAENTGMDLDIPMNGGFRTLTVKGDVWYLGYGGDNLVEMIAKVKAYGESLGAEFLRWDEYHAVLRKDLGNGEVWWLRARFENGLEMAVARTLRIDPGKPVAFAMGEGGRAEVRFFADNPGGRFRSIIVKLPEGEFTLEASQVMRAGAYTRTLNGKWDMDAGRAKRFAIDSIPQEPGTCCFTLSTNPGGPAVNVEVSLEEHDQRVPVAVMGEKLGALRIKNVPYGMARVRTAGRFVSTSVEHPEFTGGSGFENGDVTPEGDAYFLLPAGLWQVEVEPTDQNTASAVRAQYVPVSSGQETLLDWPLAMTAVFGSEGGNGLVVNSVARTGAEVDVTFSLHGPEAEGLEPAAGELVVREGGSPARVLSLERTDIPLDIVLLVDSSGSMKGQMQNALDATRKFLETLPDDARVRLVDFDTKPRPLDGVTRAEALKGLSSIKANGATCLNDSILLGLQMLSGSRRPALLVFTDGFDANHNDTGPGSTATKEETLEAVAAARTPVFTIGFGKGHDVDTLDRIASLSGGRYYAASDPDSLGGVFAVISSNLSNTFTARYARPARGRASDVPVVTCMMDISGSMNTTPDMAGCDYRIDKVKTILHDFFLSLPKDTLAQAMTFSDENIIQQVTTSGMGAILAALNDVDPNGGTEMAQAVTAALKAQKAIPSSKRYLIFLTDAALEVDDDEKVEFDTMLAKLRDEGIHCLWAGIGALDEAPFRYAAAASGGRFVMTEDPDELVRAFEEMIAEIRMPAATEGDVQTLVELTLNHRKPSGRNLTFAGAEQAELPVLETDMAVEVPASISHAQRDLKERFDPEVAGLLTGDSMPIRDARITKRIPIGVTGRNTAARFNVREAYFLNRMHGLDAPTGYRFLALTMGLDNILPRQKVLVYPDGSNHPAAWVGNDKALRGKEVEMVPTYVIPDLQRHLFLRWNNEVMTPVSPVTWLAEAPLMVPGESEVALPPGETVSGAVVFLVPEGNMRQMSLHYYDTVYGHAAIPLVGTMPADTDRLSSLPAKPPARLSDAFSLAVREVRDVKRIGRIEAEGDSVFRIVEADLVSNVQALLDVDPARRFSLRFNTREGALSVRLHEATAMLPLGFYSPTMLSPGSGNRILLAFRVPASVPEEAGLGELMVDVQGGGVVIPLDDRAAGAPMATPPVNALRGDGIGLQLNAFAPLAGQEDTYVADVTLFDSKDGKSTQLAGAFILRKKNFEPGPGYEPPPPDYGKSKGLAGFATGNAIIPVGTMPPASDTDALVFGVTDDTVVPDGGSQRGLILFKLPYGDTDPSEWMLFSQFFPDLKADAASEEYREERLLVRRQAVSVPFTGSLMEELTDVVAGLTRQREARRFEKPGHYRPKVKDLEGNAPPARAVPVPEVTDPARADFDSIRTLADLKVRLQGVRCLPADLGEWKHLFAPEAVLTQGWGSQADFAYMAEVILARQGVTTRRLSLELTDRDELVRITGIGDVGISSLPALEYRDDDGNRHVLVAPFLKTTAELPGMTGRVEADDVSADPKTATVTVSLLARPVQTGQSRAGRELSDALSGDTDADAPEPFHLLTANPTLPELSRGAVDLGYTVVGHGNGPVIKAVFDGNDRRVIGSDTIDSGDYEIVGERIVIFLDGEELVTEYMLEEGESVVDRFHTLGLNLPDMDMDAARRLDATLQAVRSLEDAPDNLSALKWYARNLIYRFVSAQTEHERELAGKMNLAVGRATKPRCIIATVSRPQGSGTVRTSLDLRRTDNQVHSTPAATPEAVHGFNIMSGLFASRLEADVMPGAGLGFFQLLPHYPADTRFFWLTQNARYDMEEELKRSVSGRVFNLLMQSRGTVLFPDQPALVDGKPRWAWLEVDPDTYRTISVLDTGERGAMVERVFTDLWKDGLDYITGGLVGISSSIWSVSAFSLVLDDYKEILAAAKKFALGLADNFSGKVTVGDFEFKGTVGSPTIETGYTGAGAGAVSAAKGAKTLYDKIKEPKIDLGGFEGGFKDGVNYYFSQAGG